MKVKTYKWFLGIAVALVVAASAAAAGAADAPKWVAALYIEAQKVIGLRWNVTPGASEYRILRKAGADADYKQVGTSAAPQFLDKNLTPGETYRYVLRSVTAGTESANSDERSVSVPGEKKVETLDPPVWDKVQATQTEEFGKISFKVGLTWVKGGPNVIAYNLYRGPKAGGPFDLLGSVQETRYVDVAVEDGKTYVYVLRALDGAFAESAASEERSVSLVAEKKVVTPAAQAEPKKEKLKLVAKKAKVLYEIRKVDDAGTMPLQYPLGVTTYGGRLYVVVLGIKKVAVYNIENGKFLFAFPADSDQPPGPDDFVMNNPNGIDADADGNLYVSDGNRIAKFTGEGKYLKQWSYPPYVYKDKAGKEITKPTGFGGVRIAPNGEIWAVDNNASRVMRADETGKVIDWLGEYDQQQRWGYGFAKPGGLSVTEKEVYVTDMMNARVVRLDREGKFLGEVGESGDAVGTFGSPRGNVIDAKGRILVVDQKSSTIQGFTPEGKYLFVVSSEDVEKPLELGLPHDLVMDKEGRLAISCVIVDKNGGGVKVIKLLED